MSKAGLDESIILTTISSQPGKYATGPDDLIALKTAGVSDKVIAAVVAAGSTSTAPAPAGAAPTAPDGAPSPEQQSLGSIRKVFIQPMPNDLDQYLRAEIAKQFKGSLTVVLDKKDADGILAGIDEERKGTGAQITGRYLGLHDNATGTVSLLDKAEKNILWTDEAGDRSLIFGVMKRGGQRKVADRLISKLKKAMETARSSKH
jgi:hypothetical protein